MAKDLKDTLEMIFPRGAAHAQAERTLQILPHPRAVYLCVREASLLSFGFSAWVRWKPLALAQLVEVSQGRRLFG